MSVIGFLTFQDFLIELDNTVLLEGQQVIRLQDHYKAERSTDLLVERIKFYVVAALDTGTDVLVCRMCTGSDLRYNKENVARLERRNKRAAWFVRRSLEKLNGYEVRPGIIAASEQSQTEANPSGLWKKADLDTKEFERRVANYDQ